MGGATRELGADVIRGQELAGGGQGEEEDQGVRCDHGGRDTVCTSLTDARHNGRDRQGGVGCCVCLGYFVVMKY